MEGRPPNWFAVGIPGAGVRKEKPNALKAGIEPITSETMTPEKDQKTAAAAGPGEEMKARIAAAGAARGFGSCGQIGGGVCVGQGDIGHKV